MKKLWILPLAAIMFSCGAPTEEAPVAEPVEEAAPVEHRQHPKMDGLKIFGEK